MDGKYPNCKSILEKSSTDGCTQSPVIVFELKKDDAGCHEACDSKDRSGAMCPTCCVN